jgi:hypothetical protein
MRADRVIVSIQQYNPPMTNSDFKALCALARAKLDGEKLPSTTKPKSVAGTPHPTASPLCDLCGERVKPGEFRYLVSVEGKGSSDRVYTLHFQCHAAWQTEVLSGGGVG